MNTVPYNRDEAVAYAHRWAHARNPQYYDFAKLGGDCTNFASQCIYAGNGIMNYTPTFGWYYTGISSRSPSWTGVEYLYNFLVSNKGPGPFAQDMDIGRIRPGDIIQLRFAGPVFQHSLVVISTGAGHTASDIHVAAHSDDADDRPLTSYSFGAIRCLHILGIYRA